MLGLISGSTEESSRDVRVPRDGAPAHERCAQIPLAVADLIPLSGVYWALMAMDLLGARDKMAKDEIIAWLLKCQQDNGAHTCAVRRC